MAELTLLEKKKIAEEINKGILSIRSILIKFKTSKSTVQRIKNSLSFYLSIPSDTSNKRVRHFKHHDLYGKIVDKIKELRKASIPISKTTIIGISKKIFEECGVFDLKFSQNLFFNFAAIPNVKRKRLCGAQQSYDSAAAANFLQNFKDITQNYSKKDIFNCDESALYIKGLAKYSYTFDETNMAKKIQKK